LNATIVIIRDDVILITEYSELSTASGAILSLVYITESGFSRSFLLALDGNTSYYYSLPFNLYPGQYMVHVYDVECDGVLPNGVGYPAVTDEFTYTTTVVGNCSQGV
jgi:hypothetical protein